MTHLDLPSGGWAELRDPRTVSERACRPVRRAMGHLSQHGRDSLADAAAKEKEGGGSVDPMLSDEDIDALWELNDQLAVALTDSWSYPEPINVDTVTSLPRGDYEALIAAAAPSLKDIFFDAAETAETVRDPKAPGPASSGSSTSFSDAESATTSDSATLETVGSIGG